MRLVVGLLVACTAGPERPSSGETGTAPATWPVEPLPRDTLVVPEDDGLTFLGVYDRRSEEAIQHLRQQREGLAEEAAVLH